MTWSTLLDNLENGSQRAASQDEHGNWHANVEVKEGILAAFRAGQNTEYPGGFVDKDNLAPRGFSADDAVRMVPGGSSVRRGAYVAPGTIIMPPAYVNIGAYIDSGTMVDSHALVGSCAQIGKNVHLSAAVQIGGVLEPVGASPVVVEDDAFIGAGCVLVEGVVVKQGAVLAPGVRLSASIPVYDCVNERTLEKGEAIPPFAIVIPGSRPASSDWAKAQGLSMSCALIVKYRDEQSDASLELEEVLR
ncbi:2,3,4,5-tetrahydropyridine-2,6-dicarboxylate N-succinyltransferase [Pseudoalteromonas sp. DL2-H2.2]|uniref:2,3,4,5-tetrahydropyridine-2,6-dicarboxylate N-succinyltransferase n=1 Tax=Pseudoalteromonas sp. DL2-H2.2 TaxID=2908889 RepID=UPI001F02E2F0|nr:2,3,4,5-tetrahydropyridine-2,6-dicarboxylate N-succinyltransferase [Pseudoalteromonas sp. DL2-H2.2]MCF2908699.1 2,3,4,5-tetrahydropyridine-2,6-dicarboxylate N-succinyltransferase [Pseudoalteromonas sp. DL2-H2.2]